MMYVIQFIVAIVAVISFAVIFSAPKKALLLCGFTGGLGWIVYYALVQLPISNVAASLVATFILTIFARLFAVVQQNPVTVYLLTGIFTLVPGAGIYYTAFYLITGDQAQFAYYGLNTFEVAAAIVFGIIFGFAIPQSIFHKLGYRRDQKKAEE